MKKIKDLYLNIKGYKATKGVTLIALVITIIVLLILASISVITLFGENGLITKSTKAREETEKAEILEKINLAVADAKLIEKENSPIYTLSTEKLNGALTLQFGQNGYTLAENSTGNGWTVTVKKYTVEIDKDGNVTFTSKSSDNNDDTTKAYTITYYLNDGTNPSDAPTGYNNGETVAFPIPTKEDFIFEGWYENDSFSGDSIINTSGKAKNINLYAKWIQETPSDYFTWTTTDTTATIIGLSDTGLQAYNSNSLEHLVIPGKYTEKTVIMINDNAFYGKDKITKVIINENIQTLSSNCFNGCTGIKELLLPISLNPTLNSGCFTNCTNIEKITFTKGSGIGINYSNSTTTTPWYISRSNLKTIILEDGITYIGNYMFSSLSIISYYYRGSQEQWLNVTVGSNNDNLTADNITYNYREQ